MKLTTNLYAYVWKGNDNNCNTYIFANTLHNNKHILIDPGHITTPFLREPAFETLSGEISGDGLKLEDIGLIALTHAHPDHIEAVSKIREKNQAPVALHKYEEEIFKRFNNIKADYYLKEGELQLDNLVEEKLEVFHTPGHSPGQIAIYWPEKKALAVGDDIFYHNTGRFDLPGGDPGQLKNSIERLSKLEVEYLLCGHPYENPGVIQGREAVKENFDFLRTHLWF